MTLTVTSFLIICPLLFLAGFVDAIGGGGGIISLPAFILAGLPPHNAVATNKLSASCGATIATAKYIKAGYVNFKLAIPTVLAAIAGSAAGAKLSLLVDEKVFMIILFCVLPLVAFLVLNRRTFGSDDEERLNLTARTFIVAIISAVIIGAYDGFYGPGTGTFLIIAFTAFAKMGIKSANGQAKVINLTTGLTSMVVFIMNGQVLYVYGIAGAVFNIAGSYLGANLALKNGRKIIRPVIIVVLILLVVKIIIDWK